MGFPCLAALALAAISSAQSYPPAWSSRATYASGDQVQTGGNIYRAIKAVTANQSSPATNSASWQLSQVLSNTTLMIGVNQTFPTLVAAWNYAINARVADGVYLHFYIATTKGNFAETFTSPFLLDHGSGARMAILGDQVANITLSFSGGNGFIIDTGHSFNTLSSLTFTNTSGNPITAIKADGNATITSVTASNFNNFGTCIQSTQASTVTVQDNCGFNGFSAYVADAETGASVYFPGGVSAGGQGEMGAQVGLFATTNGQIVARNSQLNILQIGCAASYGGIIDVTGSNLSENVYGAQATFDGVIIMGDATASSCFTGVFASSRSYVDCRGSTFQQNSLDVSADVGAGIEASGSLFASTYVGSFGAFINH